MAGNDKGYNVIGISGGGLGIEVGGRSVMLPGPIAEEVCTDALVKLGWVFGRQTGLMVGDVTREMDLPSRARMIEGLRASGRAEPPVEMVRRFMAAPWTREFPTLNHQRSGPSGPSGPGGAPRTRKFVKEPAPAPVAKTPVKKPAKAQGTPPADKPIDLPVLFEDPEEQLRYEAYHHYLLTTPTSQRETFGWPPFKMLPTFLSDVESHKGQVSRQQILGAIVDVVSGRVRVVNSREPRVLREGGGDAGRAPVVRSFDGAAAWRANISNATAAARRIMWWQPKSSPTMSGIVELARLATHDDMDMPER